MPSIASETIESKINYETCRNQAEIYELAACKGFMMDKFSDLYLSSGFCSDSYDKEWSLYHTTRPEECIDILSEEHFTCPKYNDGKGIFDPDTAWWIGFTYRQLQIETLVPSRKLKDIIPFSEMVACYPGLHTVDEEFATDMICEHHRLVKA